MFIRLLLLINVLFVGGCTTVEFSPANSNDMHVSIVTPDQVRVFRSSNLDKPYKEIGLLHLKGGTNLNASIDAMKEKAAAKGGNAIIDLKIIPGGSIGTVIVLDK